MALSERRSGRRTRGCEGPIAPLSPSLPTPDTLTGYVSALTAASRQARRRSGQTSMRISLAGVGVEILVARPELGETLSPALRHLPMPTTADLRVHVWDGVSGDLPSPPWNEKNVVARGEIAGLGPMVSAAVTTRTFSLLDRGSGQAFFWTPDGRTLPWWERAAPFRTILSWSLEDRERYFVHAAGVASGGKAVLLAGPGGSGKSTTSVACLAAGLDFLGGDYVIFSQSTSPSVHSIYSSAKLDDRSLDLIPALKPLVAGPKQRDNDKNVIYLEERFRERLVSDATLIAILLPSIGPSTSLVRASPAATLRLLAPSSIFQLPGAGKSTFQAISALVQTIPSSHLQIGPDPSGAVKAIAALLGKD